jgi:hypothetical protein
MESYIDILDKEFKAEDNSFLIQLRIELKWDDEAFSRLTEAMRAYCDNHSQETKVDRWIAEGFWYISTFTRSWSSHPQFARLHPSDYYEKVYQLLDELAYRFFIGQSPYNKK